jgi:hypothetical protein
MSNKKTVFERVVEFNEAVGNLKGDVNNINWDKIRSQCKNIFDEYIELLRGLGADEAAIREIQYGHESAFRHDDVWYYEPNLESVRDALCDIPVFSYGAQHLLGVNGDNDLEDVIDGLFTRFIKNEEDKQATISMHAAKGVTEVYFEGEFPKMVMKSAKDQPDAPKGKVLKSASYKNTVFRPVPEAPLP